MGLDDGVDDGLGQPVVGLADVGLLGRHGGDGVGRDEGISMCRGAEGEEGGHDKAPCSFGGGMAAWPPGRTSVGREGFATHGRRVGQATVKGAAMPSSTWGWPVAGSGTWQTAT